MAITHNTIRSQFKTHFQNKKTAQDFSAIMDKWLGEIIKKESLEKAGKKKNTPFFQEYLDSLIKFYNALCAIQKDIKGNNINADEIQNKFVDAFVELFIKLNHFYHIAPRFDGFEDPLLVEFKKELLVLKDEIVQIADSNTLEELDQDFVKIRFITQDNFYSAIEEEKYIAHCKLYATIYCRFIQSFLKDLKLRDELKKIAVNITAFDPKQDELNSMLTKVVQEVQNKINSLLSNENDKDQINPQESICLLQDVGLLVNFTNELYFFSFQLMPAERKNFVQILETVKVNASNYTYAILRRAIFEKFNYESYLFPNIVKEVKKVSVAIQQTKVESWGEFVKEINRLRKNTSFYHFKVRGLCDESVSQIINHFIRLKQLNNEDLQQLVIAFCSCIEPIPQKYLVILLLRKRFFELGQEYQVMLLHALLAQEMLEGVPSSNLYLLLNQASMQKRRDSNFIPFDKEFDCNGIRISLRDIIVRHNAWIDSRTNSFVTRLFYNTRNFSAKKINIYSNQFSQGLSKDEAIKCLNVENEKRTQHVTKKFKDVEDDFEKNLKNEALQILNSLKAKGIDFQKDFSDKSLAYILQQLMKIQDKVDLLYQANIKDLLIRNQFHKSLKERKNDIMQRHVSADVYVELYSRLDALLIVATRALATDWVEVRNEATTIAGGVIEVAGELVPIPVVQGIIKLIGQSVSGAGKRYRIWQAGRMASISLSTSETGVFVKLLVTELLYDLRDDIAQIAEKSKWDLIDGLYAKIVAVLTKRCDVADPLKQKIPEGQTEEEVLKKVVSDYVDLIKQPGINFIESWLPIKLKLSDQTMEQKEITLDNFLTGELSRKRSRAEVKVTEIWHDKILLRVKEIEQRINQENEEELDHNESLHFISPVKNSKQEEDNFAGMFKLEEFEKQQQIPSEQQIIPEIKRKIRESLTLQEIPWLQNEESNDDFLKEVSNKNIRAFQELIGFEASTANKIKHFMNKIRLHKETLLEKLQNEKFPKTEAFIEQNKLVVGEDGKALPEAFLDFLEENFSPLEENPFAILGDPTSIDRANYAHKIGLLYYRMRLDFAGFENLLTATCKILLFFGLWHLYYSEMQEVFSSCDCDIEYSAFQDFFIAPIQKLTKYHLFFKEMIPETPKEAKNMQSLPGIAETQNMNIFEAIGQNGLTPCLESMECYSKGLNEFVNNIEKHVPSNIPNVAEAPNFDAVKLFVQGTLIGKRDSEVSPYATYLRNTMWKESGKSPFAITRKPFSTTSTPLKIK